jgi:hypothetical protein
MKHEAASKSKAAESHGTVTPLALLSTVFALPLGAKPVSHRKTCVISDKANPMWE